ncbi:MAG: hypothetical protein ABI882_16725 [Acidobacteriota bacterium]
MSEYQYYEFRAIDRHLTKPEMTALRARSSRAQITPTSFVNEYSWGNFRGNADKWMEKYFDAFLQFDAWGTHVLKLRLPAEVINPKIVKQYCVGESAFVSKGRGDLIITFFADETDPDWSIDPEKLDSFIPLRTELARGDLRALYLGWLLCVQNEELDEDDLEPAVPPGLGRLSPALGILVDFLEIDPYLLLVAAESSPPLKEFELRPEEVRSWVSSLPIKDKDRLLADTVINGGQAVSAALLSRFLIERGPRPDVESGARRTAGELLTAANAKFEERQRVQREKRDQEEAARVRAEEAAREKYLESLAGREEGVWAEIEFLIAKKQQGTYQRAVELVIDLRDVEERTKEDDFHTRLEELWNRHIRKFAFVERLRKAGLVGWDEGGSPKLF